MKPFLISAITKFKACSLGAQAAIWCGSVAVVSSAIAVPVIIANTQKPAEEAVVEEIPLEDMGRGGDIDGEPNPEMEPEPEPTPEEPKEEVKPEPTPTPAPTPQPQPVPSYQGTPLPEHKVGDELVVTEERCHISDGAFLCYTGEGTKEELDAWFEYMFAND